MLKKVMAAASLAASVVGIAAVGAPQALAIGDDSGTTSASGNGASQSFGNSATFGDKSPQLSLVQGSLNKICVAAPSKTNTQTLVGGGELADVVGLQDVGILSSPQTQTCTENSTQAKGDEPLSHILDDIAALSGNGTGNG
ncbi:rodlin [Streptomyces sp. YIM S03343]